MKNMLLTGIIVAGLLMTSCGNSNSNNANTPNGDSSAPISDTSRMNGNPAAPDTLHRDSSSLTDSTKRP